MFSRSMVRLLQDSHSDREYVGLFIGVNALSIGFQFFITSVNRELHLPDLPTLLPGLELYLMCPL